MKLYACDLHPQHLVVLVALHPSHGEDLLGLVHLVGPYASDEVGQACLPALNDAEVEKFQEGEVQDNHDLEEGRREVGQEDKNPPDYQLEMVGS